MKKVLICLLALASASYATANPKMPHTRTGKRKSPA